MYYAIRYGSLGPYIIAQGVSRDEVDKQMRGSQSGWMRKPASQVSRSAIRAFEAKQAHQREVAAMRQDED